MPQLQVSKQANTKQTVAQSKYFEVMPHGDLVEALFSSSGTPPHQSWARCKNNYNSTCGLTDLFS